MTQIEINELYKTNKDFKEYVDKYAKHHQMMSDDALKSRIVKEVAISKAGGR